MLIKSPVRAVDTQTRRTYNGYMENRAEPTRDIIPANSAINGWAEYDAGICAQCGRDIYLEKRGWSHEFQADGLPALGFTPRCHEDGTEYETMAITWSENAR